MSPQMPVELPDWARQPQEVLGLRPSTLVVLAVLRARGPVWVEQRELQRLTGLQATTLSHALRLLEGAGAVRASAGRGERRGRQPSWVLVPEVVDAVLGGLMDHLGAAGDVRVARGCGSRRWVS